MPTDPGAFYAKLEADGVENVRSLLAQGVYATGDRRRLVEEWLCRKDADRDAAVAKRAEVREDKRIELAQDANEIAKSALMTARIACGISVLSLIVAAVAAYFAMR